MKKISSEVTQEQLIADFKTVVEDAEALLKATAKHGGEDLAEIRARAESSIKAVKARIVEEQEALLIRTKEAARATDVYVHENPWAAIGVAASIGMVMGLLFGRR